MPRRPYPLENTEDYVRFMSSANAKTPWWLGNKVMTWRGVVIVVLVTIGLVVGIIHACKTLLPLL